VSLCQTTGDKSTNHLLCYPSAPGSFINPTGGGDDSNAFWQFRNCHFQSHLVVFVRFACALALKNFRLSLRFFCGDAPRLQRSWLAIYLDIALGLDQRPCLSCSALPQRYADITPSRVSRAKFIDELPARPLHA